MVQGCTGWDCAGWFRITRYDDCTACSSSIVRDGATPHNSVPCHTILHRSAQLPSSSTILHHPSTIRHHIAPFHSIQHHSAPFGKIMRARSSVIPIIPQLPPPSRSILTILYHSSPSEPIRIIPHRPASFRTILHQYVPLSTIHHHPAPIGTILHQSVSSHTILYHCAPLQHHSTASGAIPCLSAPSPAFPHHPLPFRIIPCLSAPSPAFPHHLF